MRRFFKLKNFFLISFLAVAGFFSAASFIAKDAINSSDPKEALAGSDGNYSASTYVSDKTLFYSGGHNKLWIWDSSSRQCQNDSSSWPGATLSSFNTGYDGDSQKTVKYYNKLNSYTPAHLIFSSSEQTKNLDWDASMPFYTNSGSVCPLVFTWGIQGQNWSDANFTFNKSTKSFEYTTSELAPGVSFAFKTQGGFRDDTTWNGNATYQYHPDIPQTTFNSDSNYKNYITSSRGTYTFTVTLANFFNYQKLIYAVSAEFTASSYNITVDLDGGTGPSSTTYSYSTSSQTKTFTAPTKTNYVFNGYSVTTAPTSGSATFDAATKRTLTIAANTYGNITIKASWALNQYTINYNKNGGSITAPTASTGTPGSTVTLKSYGGTKTGYTLTGWNTKSNGSGTHYGLTATIDPGLSAGGSLTLYAEWTAKTTTLTFNLNSGSGGGGIVDYHPTATYGSTMPSITSYAAPTRDGFTFGGYYDTGASTGGTQYYTSSRASATSWNYEDSTKTLYARWIANEYTITFYQNDKPNPDESYSTTETKTGGETYTFPSLGSMTSPRAPSGGRHFLWWHTDPHGESGTKYEVGSTYSTNSNLKLYMIQDWYSYEYSLDNGTHWYPLVRKTESITSGYVTEYYPENNIDLLSGQKITFQRYYQAGPKEEIGGSLSFENNYDAVNGVKYCVNGKFYLKITATGDNVVYVEGESTATTRMIVITRGGNDLYYPLYENAVHEWVTSGYISVQENDIIKGHYSASNPPSTYPVTHNTYSQGSWDDVATGVEATAPAVVKIYLQASSGSNFDIVYFQMDGLASAIFFAQTFNSEVGAVCDGIVHSQKDLEDLQPVWGLNDTQGLYHSYSLLDDVAKTYLVDTSADTDIKAFFAKYDYVLKKYGTSNLGDFMGRKNTIGANAVRNFTPFNPITGDDGDNAATILIIVASSISILSITALSVLMVKKRKSKEQ